MCEQSDLNLTKVTKFISFFLTSETIQKREIFDSAFVGGYPAGGQHCFNLGTAMLIV